MSDTVCFWCETDCGATCLGVTRSTQMRPDDPANVLLRDGRTSTPMVYRKGCYICEDPEYAQMGMSLCRKCPACGGHIAADDVVCDDCGAQDGPPGPGEAPDTPPPAPSIDTLPSTTVPLHVALSRLEEIMFGGRDE